MAVRESRSVMQNDTRAEDAPQARTLSPAAEFAGYAGLVPFVLAFLGVALLPDSGQRELAQRLALGYGAAILSFVGAVHWGLALARRLPFDAPIVLASILPSVVATAAVLLGGQRGLAALVGGFGLFWLYEHRRLGEALPGDYLALRRNLTLMVCATLALTAIISERAGLL